MTPQEIAEIGHEYDGEPAETCGDLYGRFVNAVLAAIHEACPGVEIDHLGGSLGSQYFAAALPGREGTGIRISNHKAGHNGETVPTWSFETRHPAKLHRMGLSEVVDAIHDAEMLDD